MQPQRPHTAIRPVESNVASVLRQLGDIRETPPVTRPSGAAGEAYASALQTPGTAFCESAQAGANSAAELR